MVKCWKCGAELEEVETYFEGKGVLIRGVKGMRCPKDGEEMFTEEQVEEIRRRIAQDAELKLPSWDQLLAYGEKFGLEKGITRDDVLKAIRIAKRAD
jgi:hypothetical protein